MNFSEICQITTTPHSVCAVMVTYHPDHNCHENIVRLLRQVNTLVLVDNGSNEGELQPLRAQSHCLGFQLIENNENLGVAEALNQGARWAKSSGYGWVIFFDQDSSATDDLIKNMFIAWESHPYRDNVASLHPRYVDPQTGVEAQVRRAPDGGPVVSMTSGALMPTWIFDKIGWFASEYFIDWVDFEYCLRIRAHGYTIADCKDAILLHAAGKAHEPHTLAGFRFRPTHHSAMRRYYLSRNRVAVIRKYFPTFPLWMMQLTYESVRETVKCFLGEEDRAQKFRNFVRGSWDGFAGRMGKRYDV